jgi:hypothetical protein
LERLTAALVERFNNLDINRLPGIRSFIGTRKHMRSVESPIDLRHFWSNTGSESESVTARPVGKRPPRTNLKIETAHSGCGRWQQALKRIVNRLHCDSDSLRLATSRLFKLNPVRVRRFPGARLRTDVRLQARPSR